ncbi:hypothetical protein ACA910_007909 [Epithemia clementina (nom. ined.)]
MEEIHGPSDDVSSEPRHDDDDVKNNATGTDCPYAVALLNQGSHHHHTNDEVDGSSVQSSDDAPIVMDDLITATRQNCPAFVKANGCPFKNASSANQVKETLLQIPSSHYEMSSFMQVLQGLHTTSNALLSSSSGGSEQQEQYHLPGGCPVPYSIKSIVPGGFREALENMSLAAIMGRMVQEFDKEDDAQQHAEETLIESSLSILESAAYVSTATATSEKSKNQSYDDEKLIAVASPLESKATPRLSHSLKTGTALAHEAAENVHFVKNFIRGQIDRRLYGEMVLSLFFIYGALEEALEVHGPTYFKQCHFPKELGRLKALREDVEFWHGPLPNNALRPSPATSDYIDRIRDIATKHPLLLLAHSYTRYLGDLSGGKILARVARRALRLDRPTGAAAADGLAFYHFEEIPSAKLFKDMYRKALDDLPLSAVQIQQLVQEANVAFLLNMRLFEELDVSANISGATVRPLEEVLKIGPDNNQNTQSTAFAMTGSLDNQCPFMERKNDIPQKKQMVGNPLLSTKGRCPWPFVLMHDPQQFARDWQTWILIGLVLAFFWSQVSSTRS